MAKPSIPMSLAKAHLRVSHTAEDELIGRMADAAVDSCLAHIGWAGQLRARLDPFYGPCVKLHFPMVDSSAVVLKRSTDAGETYATTLTKDVDWTIQGTDETGYLIDAPAFSGSFLRAEYEAGWAADEVPSWFLTACLFMLAHYYENRSSVIIGQGIVVQELPLAVSALLDPWKVVLFA